MKNVTRNQQKESSFLCAAYIPTLKTENARKIFLQKRGENPGDLNRILGTRTIKHLDQRNFFPQPAPGATVPLHAPRVLAHASDALCPSDYGWNGSHGYDQIGSHEYDQNGDPEKPSRRFVADWLMSLVGKAVQILSWVAEQPGLRSQSGRLAPVHSRLCADSRRRGRSEGQGQGVCYLLASSLR